jgi:hypothetical protein
MVAKCWRPKISLSPSLEKREVPRAEHGKIEAIQV